MKVLIAGSSGLIGSELTNYLKDRGFDIIRLVRKESEVVDDSLLWSPEHHEINLDDFEGFDVVINLAGENIATGRWTKEKKKKIEESRVRFTHMLSELLTKLKSPPKLLINASAVGYYGNRPGEILNEDSAPGKGFLSEVCQKWEEALEHAISKGIRVVPIRIGVVLSSKGGALTKMLTSFRLGLGGKISKGCQYMSWIAIDDLVRIIHYIIENESISGPVNATSPNPITNKVFTKTLGKVIKRPTIFPLPAFVAKIILGREMANELLLSSTRAMPDKLLSLSFSFQFGDLEKALRHTLKK